LWKSRRNKQTNKKVVKLLDAAVKQFPHSIALLQEYALWLVETNRHEEVVALLRPFESLCNVFSDFETLSRIGRVYKDFGDRSLQKSTVPITALATHPAWQCYGAALQRYQDAFQLSRDYYPGINAATMACIRGDTQLAREMADEVARICSIKDLSSIDREERIWVLATEGEAYLIKEEPQLAARFYAQALELVSPHESGVVQSIYDQICRLWWALGGSVVDPVVEIIENSPFWDELAAGPLGDCGYS
jgi:tetratricopeptide (TPR) repeat protein